jgi:hypothetical protein
MIIIRLNNIAFNGRFDSSIPTSYVAPHIAGALMGLDNVAVTTILRQEDITISCVLNFTVYERLISDCVLGADFFTHISESGHLRAFFFL